MQSLAVTPERSILFGRESGEPYRKTINRSDCLAQALTYYDLRTKCFQSGLSRWPISSPPMDRCSVPPNGKAGKPGTLRLPGVRRR
jgi:hypothetical protein